FLNHAVTTANAVSVHSAAIPPAAAARATRETWLPPSAEATAAAKPVTAPATVCEHVYTAHLRCGRPNAPMFDIAATTMAASGPKRTAAKRIGIKENDA